jgi:C1A family cysteine protease
VGILDTKMYLSPQQIVSCDSGDYGCDGGWTEGAYDYVISAGGLVSVEDYPYKSYWDTTGECTLDVADAKLATIDSFYKISKEEDMEAYVLSTGPLSVCLDASSWYTYVWGVVTTCGDEVDHCVQVVGLNAEDDYWIVRNSWGVDWGMEGYILLESGVDMCNITSWASYTNAVEP